MEKIRLICIVCNISLDLNLDFNKNDLNLGEDRCQNKQLHRSRSILLYSEKDIDVTSQYLFLFLRLH